MNIILVTNKKDPLKGVLRCCKKLSVSLFPLNLIKHLLHTTLISHEYLEVEIPIVPVFKLSQRWKQKVLKAGFEYFGLSEKCVWGVSDRINLHLVD